ncbi:carboxypeptidase-like regulatory domain-containing protein [Flavobacterium sp. xlx-214]|uniref:carboxypeptidase-like regulatory domain-containing protein n=1 Tax=unclassified Flavobacterium TaxID=196869 RepID=UPI0013CFE80B|nr:MULTISPECIES: carboxypeptidase-like regulatory domain-containing protein [unclassified Flavobacterium]MBA5793177.1 carboxypeptidase-like regulatory domain-containing protein [Flavobacterium sp. xlx-221]QMI82540.1 carboxypeptidase-like regulatory domain-containing protein [Flavobacterium sp. xlx-214]
MQPQHRGKFCMQCSKEVIDFTKRSNKEIVEIIESSKGSFCGRLSTHQLNKPIEIPSKKNNFKIVKTLAAVFLLGSTGSLFAIPLSEKTKSVSVSKSNTNFKRLDLKQIKTDTLKNTITGQVLTDFEDSIPGVEVFIKELNLKTKTDSDGNFSFTLSEDISEDYITILVEYLGFEKLSVRAYKIDWHIKKNLYLKEDEQLAFTGEVAIEYVKKRWWQFWKRF